MKPNMIARAVILIAAITAAAQSDENDVAKADLAKLQGEWAMVSSSLDGQVTPPEFLATAKRVCREDETTVTINGQLILKAKFTLDPTKMPKTIDYDVIDGPTKGRKHLGIYEFDGEQVKFCFGSPDAQRPAEFSSQPGDGRTFSIWKRVAAAAP